VAPDFGGFGRWAANLNSRASFRCLFKGTRRSASYPGLEPWATLYKPAKNPHSSHHAHCRMSFIFPAVCTIVSAYRSASKVAALEKRYANSNGTKSACMAAPKDRKHRLINPHRPNDASSLQYFAPRGRLDPTTRIVDSYRPNECSDNKSKG
jgi:hypothetical protein